jgi:hypothetical protein
MTTNRSLFQPEFWMSKGEYQEKGLRVLEKMGVQA